MAAESESLSSAFGALTKNDSADWWVIGNFEANAADASLFAKGTDGFETMKKSLDQTKILHGVFKVLGVDDRGNVVATRPKFVAFTFIGTSVSAMKRGQAGPQKDKLKKTFFGTHLELQIDDLADFTQEAVAKRLLASGGAHKPTRYEFGPASDNVEANIQTVESLIGQKHT